MLRVVSVALIVTGASDKITTEKCTAPPKKEEVERQPLNYTEIWNSPLFQAPSGCARPQKQCGVGHEPPSAPYIPVPHVMLSGRGKWYWAGPDCNGSQMATVLTHSLVGHTFHLVDEDIIIAEHTIQKDDLFIQGLPCHKMTMDINCAKEFVGKTPFIGMHVLCFAKNRVCAYRDGSGVCELLEGEDLTTVEQIAHAMRLVPRREGQNPMRFYTLDGKWVATVHGHFALLLFENGVWMWPTMEMDYTRKVTLSDRTVHMVTKSITPAIFEIVEPMIDDSEIDRLLKATAGKLVSSPVSEKTRHQDKTKRTSTGFFLTPTKVDDHLFKFMVRAQSLIRIPLTRAEELQVINYQPDQFYITHPDSVHLYSPISQDRVATFFTNMKTVEKGGATGFPHSRAPSNVSNPECAAFEMPASKGRSIFWYNSYANGDVNGAADHTGCAVKVGEKTGSNFWFWDGYAPNYLKDKYIWMHDERTVKAARPYFNDEDNKIFYELFAKRYGN